MADPQVIPTHTWTRLEGYDVDVHHQHPGNINVWVADGELKTSAEDAVAVLRPTGGSYAPGWRVPVRGTYYFRTDRNAGAMVVALDTGQIVIRDAEWVTDTFGREVFSGPEIGQSSGGSLMTDGVEAQRLELSDRG